ncbi:SRPBCC family protein [Bradyrhizobium tropiciagri]|uniref:SRPBCC family protein n=1 Tax=Bradyrhizobium tropiciagri TaxID=312253 RepID=UPI002010CE75|nr:SRPBCC family protein [Bradyrhizobium tropiciagri]
MIKIDPKLDLVLEREIDVPVELVWKAWTTAEHLRHWFAPRPWSITACDLDLRPGGAINFTMRSPEGHEFPNTQCYLEVSPFERLIITDTLLGGYRPSPNPFFTAVLELARNGTGTRYKAIAIHGNDEARKRHEEMGFHDGWGTVATQMVEYIKSGRMHS